MTLTNYLVLLACVFGISTGQVLFKLAARPAAGGGFSLFQLLTSVPFIAALAVYGVATLVWVWQLSQIDLSRAYPFMALSFVLVPLFGVFLFGETVALRYWIGIALIVCGIVITVT